MLARHLQKPVDVQLIALLRPQKKSTDLEPPPPKRGESFDGEHAQLTNQRFAHKHTPLIQDSFEGMHLCGTVQSHSQREN